MNVKRHVSTFEERQTPQSAQEIHGLNEQFWISDKKDVLGTVESVIKTYMMNWVVGLEDRPTADHTFKQFWC
jgi:hypothetical protein